MFKKLCLSWLVVTLWLTTWPAHAAEGPVTLGLGTLTSIALSPDGTRLAVATTVGVYFYDAQTFTPLGQWAGSLPGENQLWHPRGDEMLWSPRGDVLMLANGREAYFYAPENGTLLWQQTHPRCSSRQDWEFCDHAFSRDGAQWVVTLPDKLTAEVYDVSTGALVETYGAPNFWAMVQWRADHLAATPAQSATGRWALGGSGQAFVYQAGSEAFYTVPFGYGAWGYNYYSPRRLALSPDGQRLAVGSSNGWVRVWQVGVTAPLFEAQGHHAGPSNIYAFAWAPDSQVVYSAAYNKVVAWNAQTGQMLRVLDGFASQMQQVVWTADGQRVIAAQGQHVGAWDIATRLPVARGTQTGSINEMVLSPTGDTLAVYDRGQVTLYDPQTLNIQRQWEVGRWIVALAFSPDGTYLATAGEGPFVNVWETATGRPVRDLVTSPHNRFVAALAFTADGQTLYGLENDGVLRRWELATGLSTTVQTPAPQRNYYYDPVISPSAQRVITERGRGGIDVSDLTTGQRLYNLNAPYPRSIILNAPATRFAAIVGDRVQIWNLADGTLVADYDGHNGRITDIVFSPDGAALASSGQDGTVQVWPVP